MTSDFSTKITKVKTALETVFVKKADIQDNLTSTDTNKPLSAKQGKQLNDNKASITHTHDDRYYTKSEVNTALNNIDEITSIVLVPKATNSDGKIIFYTGDEPS